MVVLSYSEVAELLTSFWIEAATVPLTDILVSPNMNLTWASIEAVIEACFSVVVILESVEVRPT